MNKQKTAPAKTRIKMLLLAIGLAGLAQPASATDRAGIAATALLEKVTVPTHLGGVPLRRLEPRQPAAVYQIGMSSDSYRLAVAEADGLRARSDPGIDPVKTAAINPGVFGSVALPMRNFPVLSRWMPIYQAMVGCSAGSACDRKSAAFANIIEIAKGKEFSEKLSFVNSSVNRLIAYRKHSVVYGNLDYWATPLETLEHRAGDCKDFTILKMTALLRAGIPPQSMSFVVLRDRKRGFFHAVLSVSTASGAFILDSLSNRVLRDSELPDYQPLYSLSTDRAWIHGSKAGTVQVADLKSGFATGL